ncbi:SH3 domain-containing protein [Tropicimonas sp. TH_r6]|uniref:SH3 domain-containing protein n=1 Tax=Tropicimonas sp. TH_r6 TaxID=3082085 RepID=UPI002953413E|nr:SH3 domain-containing protein [Tropicimonas sp. TH_r6]MDV7143285.1 SH3 domain-containing protein [Tropicimonas sp. TH_r6]
MVSKAVLVAAVIAMLHPGVAAVDASGPDYFRVVGVAWNDVLNIRNGPTARASKIGAIPPDGNGVRNLGCSGGMTYAQWEAATPTQRDAARKRVWCRIYYRGVEGWVAGWFLAEGSAN